MATIKELEQILKELKTVVCDMHKDISEQIEWEVSNERMESK